MSYLKIIMDRDAASQPVLVDCLTYDDLKINTLISVIIEISPSYHTTLPSSHPGLG